MEGEECQVVTPPLSCSSPSYLVRDQGGVLLESGSLSVFANKSYYFNFFYGVGEYEVIISCDDWSRQLFVIEKEEGVSGMSFPSIFGIILLLLVVIVLSIIFFFYNRDDIWFQGLFLVSGCVSLGFLFFMGLNITEVQLGYNSEFNSYVSDNDFSSTNTNILFINNSNKFLFEFNDFDGRSIDSVSYSEFCFRFNNSGGLNKLGVFKDNSRISDYFFIENNSVSSKCVEFSSSFIENGAKLGVGCVDCSISNNFGLLLDNSSSNVNVLVLNSSYYNVISSKPLLYKVNVRLPPFESIRDYFFLYMWFFGIMIMLLFFRLLVLFVTKYKEVVEK